MVGRNVNLRPDIQNGKVTNKTVLELKMYTQNFSNKDSQKFIK